MNIFLCGQRTFGTEVLKALMAAGHTIVGVAPPPITKKYDKLRGYATMKKLPIISDCDSLVSAEIPDNTDLIVSAHSHWLISSQCIAKAKYGGIGFHPSLLPRHRGKDAVRWAIHMGDFASGGTVYELNDKTDGGYILKQQMVWIEPEWDYHDLWNAIFPIGVQMVVDTVAEIESHTETRIEQNEAFATWEPSWDRARLKRNELAMIPDSATSGTEEYEFDFD